MAAHGYRGHIRRIGEEKLDTRGEKRYPARRWVVVEGDSDTIGVGAW